MYEIERKFLIKSMPTQLNLPNPIKIIQAYLHDDPVLRIRQFGSEFFFTYKGYGLLKRKEIDIKISQETFNELISNCDNIIVKNRYLIKSNNNLIELDVFCNKLSGLIIAEVEFSSEALATAFIPPKWFNEEVTLNSIFQNVNLRGKSYEQIINNIRI